MAKINVQDIEVSVIKVNGEDYICLTDIARHQLQEHIIFKWMSLKSTIDYLGEWEILYNPYFNCTEFGTIRNAAGGNNFVLSTKMWIERTNAIGIYSKSGRYGGTYAHKDLAYHFGMWISPRFHLLLVRSINALKLLNKRNLGGVPSANSLKSTITFIPTPLGSILFRKCFQESRLARCMPVRRMC